MNTSRSRPKILETRFVWGANVPECMELAMKMQAIGWSIQGNPAPMIYNGTHGTGVAISRENDGD